MIEPEVRMWMAVMNRIYLDSQSDDQDVKSETIEFLHTPEFSYICGLTGVPLNKAINVFKSRVSSQ